MDFQKFGIKIIGRALILKYIYIIKILDHYKRVKIDQKLQIRNFKIDFWSKFGIFTPFLDFVFFPYRVSKRKNFDTKILKIHQKLNYIEI